VIIWQADKLNPAASNKLLKILEEPPDKTLFILVCENDEMLLKTIVSRTQIIKLRRIADDELINALQENHGVSLDIATSITNLSDGNYSEALQLIADNENAEQNFNNFQKLMRVSIKFDALTLIKWIDEIAKSGRERQKKFLTYSLHIVRECMMFNNGMKQLIKLTDKEIEFVKKFAPFIHVKNNEQFMDEINKAYYHIERNANPKILFMDLAFKFNELLNLPKP
jgi:DNA polymerase-3 subunit delta'